eukprot:scaffold13463_cov51-Phaeocystis_antarctica.AAC.2
MSEATWARLETASSESSTLRCAAVWTCSRHAVASEASQGSASPSTSRFGPGQPALVLGRASQHASRMAPSTPRLLAARSSLRLRSSPTPSPTK